MYLLLIVLRSADNHKLNSLSDLREDSDSIVDISQKYYLVASYDRQFLFDRILRLRELSLEPRTTQVEYQHPVSQQSIADRLHSATSEVYSVRFAYKSRYINFRNPAVQSTVA